MIQSVKNVANNFIKTNAKNLNQNSFKNILLEKKSANNIKGYFNEIMQSGSELNHIVKATLQIKDISMKQALYLQARTHQISFELQTAAKMVETSTNALKAIMQTQA